MSKVVVVAVPFLDRALLAHSVLHAPIPRGMASSLVVIDRWTTGRVSWRHSLDDHKGYLMKEGLWQAMPMSPER